MSDNDPNAIGRADIRIGVDIWPESFLSRAIPEPMLQCLLQHFASRDTIHKGRIGLKGLID